MINVLCGVDWNVENHKDMLLYLTPYCILIIVIILIVLKKCYFQEA